jgi:hypothetical protein
MDEPPFILDAASVVEFTVLDLSGPGARFSFVAGGVSIDARSVSRLVITRSLLDEAVFLLHCSDRWETVAAEPFAGIDAAERAAATAYAGIALAWTRYRELTPAEESEMRTTRSFLKELAAEDGEGAAP